MTEIKQRGQPYAGDGVYVGALPVLSPKENCSGFVEHITTCAIIISQSHCIHTPRIDVHILYGTACIEGIGIERKHQASPFKL